MTRFLYLVRHGEASPHDGPLSDIGREQARLVGERLGAVPFAAIHHGPSERTTQTAAVIAESHPGVPVLDSELAGDYLPSAPDPAGLPPRYAAVVSSYLPAERVEGAGLAAAAVERFAVAGDEEADMHELIVTHNFLIGWLVSHAMLAPPWRWLGLNQLNGALSVIGYQRGLPPRLISFNDAAHLPPVLRWTGFPAGAAPASG